VRHVILEGPDGGGKSRLAEAILATYPAVMHAKASHSTRGPVRNLAAWVRDDIDKMATFETLNVYDRHPIISEPIYGWLCRGNPQPGFLGRLDGTSSGNPWLSTQRLSLYEHALVVWCIPTLEQCMAAVDPERDMPGVVDNIEKIHEWYLLMMRAWGGPSIRYDFTDPKYTRDVLPRTGLFSGAVEFVMENGHVFQECIDGPR